ncbi:MAG: DUF881 domain-containing protein [Chloroflexi bacterium]|nr:DUF881 domain-containing protein [Chloroflexota bacterium]
MGKTTLSKGTIILTLFGLLLGLLLSAQWQARPPSVAISAQPRPEVMSTIQRLETEQAELKKQITQLRAQITAQQQQAATEKETLSEIRQALERERMAAGMVAVKGPGLRITLDDSASKTIPANEDPSLYLVHEYDLRDVVNLFWSAGAEVISLNGERMVAITSIYCVGSTIMVNNTRLSPPYDLLAIGDAEAMESALNDSANLKTLKTRAKVYGVQFKASRARELNIPAYNGSIVLNYVRLSSRR